MKTIKNNDIEWLPKGKYSIAFAYSTSEYADELGFRDGCYILHWDEKTYGGTIDEICLIAKDLQDTQNATPHYNSMNGSNGMRFAFRKAKEAFAKAGI